MTPAQYGHLMENAAEAAWTEGSAGRLVTYLPVLDSHAVDRAVTSAAGGPPLFVQVKAHRRARPGDRLAFALPLSDVGAYDGWLCLFLEGEPDQLREAYLVPGSDLLQKAERGTLVDGRPCLRLTLSPTSPTWSPYLAPDLAAALEEHFAQPLAAEPPPRRSQEAGAYFEESIAAAVLGATDELALYRPAVDVGRDLLVQRAGSCASLYVQIKGTEREDRPGLARFQVRRRTFAPDPDVAFLFCYRNAGREIDPVWLVPAADLAAGASGGDADHLSFEAHITGPDERWQGHRLRLSDLSGRLLDTIDTGAPSATGL